MAAQLGSGPGVPLTVAAAAPEGETSTANAAAVDTSRPDRASSRHHDELSTSRSSFVVVSTRPPRGALSPMYRPLQTICLQTKSFAHHPAEGNPATWAESES